MNPKNIFLELFLMILSQQDGGRCKCVSTISLALDLHESDTRPMCISLDNHRGEREGRKGEERGGEGRGGERRKGEWRGGGGEGGGEWRGGWEGNTKIFIDPTLVIRP